MSKIFLHFVIALIYKKAIKITVRKYRHFFENFLDEIAEEEDEEEEGEED
jgi:hypothetical protein